MEGVVRDGTDRSHFGDEPIYKAKKHNSDGSEEMCMIYVSWEGEARRRTIARDKVINFIVSNYIIKKLLPENVRSVYAPEVIGQKIIYEDQEKGIINREYYLSYEPRQTPSYKLKIDVEDYAKFLGRDIARFMYCGMSNVPRHLRSNFRNNSFRTCIIDLDITDPRVFDWIIADLYPVGSTNYQALLMNEGYFFEEASDSFLNALLPDEVRTRDTIRELKSIYTDSFVEEVERLKGVGAAGRFKPLIQR